MEDIIMFETMLQRYKRDLAIKGYSKKTEDVYYRNIIYFFEYIQLQPEEVTRELVKDYLYYLSEERKLSSSSLRQARASIVYFYSQTLPMPMAISNIPVK
jgi:integrase/recombinase XerD